MSWLVNFSCGCCCCWLESKFRVYDTRRFPGPMNLRPNNADVSHTASLRPQDYEPTTLSQCATTRHDIIPRLRHCHSGAAVCRANTRYDTLRHITPWPRHNQAVCYRPAVVGSFCIVGCRFTSSGLTEFVSPELLPTHLLCYAWKSVPRMFACIDI